MKTKEFKEIKNKSGEELRKDLIVHQERLRQLRFDLSAGKVKNIKEMKQSKKTVAQILTLINQKPINQK